MRQLRNWLVASLILSATLLPTAAAFASEREAVRVVYEAPDECPAASAFEGAFAEHLGPAALAEIGELARTLTVVVERRDGGYAARVELADTDGTPRSRDVSAPTCAQAVQAIALVAALAARAQFEQTGAGRPTDDATRVAPVASNADTSASQAPAPTPSSQPEHAREPQPPTGAAGANKPIRLRGEASLGVGVTSGIGPSAAPGLFAEGRLGIAGEPMRSAALLFLAHDTSRTSTENGDIRVQLLRGRLELCPLEPRLASSFRLSPCVGGELGSQTGRAYNGSGVVSAHSESRLWAAGTLALRVRFVSGLLTLAAGPELVVPFLRNSFALRDPERPLYTVPAAAFGGGLSAGAGW